MTRYFFEISYKGKNYHGWQRQANSVSVQETIESCFSKLYSNKEIGIIGCGRTDAGVHAKQYFFHVDLENSEDIDPAAFQTQGDMINTWVTMI